MTRAQFKVVTDNGVVAGALIRQGYGVMPKEFAVLLPVPSRLIPRRELLTSRRIRVVHDLLAEASC